MMSVQRAFIERRSGKDRRKRLHLRTFLYKGRERRLHLERRVSDERRSDWIRVTRFSSAPLRELKIARFLVGEEGGGGRRACSGKP